MPEWPRPDDPNDPWSSDDTDQSQSDPPPGEHSRGRHSSGEHSSGDHDDQAAHDTGEWERDALGGLAAWEPAAPTSSRAAHERTEHPGHAGHPADLDDDAWAHQEAVEAPPGDEELGTTPAVELPSRDEIEASADDGSSAPGPEHRRGDKNAVRERTSGDHHLLDRFPGRSGRRGRSDIDAAEVAHRRRRRRIVALVLGVLILGGLIDRTGSSRPVQAAPIPPLPMAAPANALSSSWFCAGASSVSHASTQGTLILSDSQDKPLTASVTLLADQDAKTPPPPPQKVTIPAHRQIQVPETIPGATGIGAMVQVDGGAASVEQQVSGVLGTSTTPCATSGSSNWYFPTGTTLRNADDDVALLNPYPGTAIVDVSFQTEQGSEAPPVLQAIAVPGRSLFVAHLATALPRREHIATTVHATGGRVVAWQTQAVTPPAPGTPIVAQSLSGAVTDPQNNPAPPVPGVDVTLGSPSSGTYWVLPEGTEGPGISEQYVVYNPTQRVAHVLLTINPDSGGPGVTQELTVQPQTPPYYVSTDVFTQLPAGEGHSASVESLNGVPVVAERAVNAEGPAPHNGFGDLIGSQLADSDWLVGANTVDPNTSESVVVANTSNAPIAVEVSKLSGGALPGDANQSIDPGRRLAIQVPAPPGGSFNDGLVVHASGPVVVERDMYGNGAHNGVSPAVAVPLQG